MSERRQPPAKWQGSTVTESRGIGRDYRTDRVDGGPLVTDGGFHVTELLEALADERRRYVIYYLLDEESAEFDDLSEQIAAWESATPAEKLDEQTRKNIRIDLYHVQLPKLEKTGMIEYDRRRGTVQLRSPPNHVEKILDRCAAIESPETTE